jgi:hypothetical protein
VTIRDKDGGYTTKRITKEGPTNLIFTTTKTQVHAENETRVLSLTTDDSREQTRRIFREMANEHNRAPHYGEWHELQHWLAAAENRVSIPYAEDLAELISPMAVRLRRDFGALLALIRTHAMLHQATREHDERGWIVATLDDYAVVHELVGDIIAAGVEATVPPIVRDTVDAVTVLAEKDGVGLRVVAERLGVDKSNASRRLRRAADGGWIHNLEDRRGKPARWVVGDPMPEDHELLPHPDALQHHNTPSDETTDQAECCAVARDSERGNGEPGEPLTHADALQLLTATFPSAEIVDEEPAP